MMNGMMMPGMMWGMALVWLLVVVVLVLTAGGSLNICGPEREPTMSKFGITVLFAIASLSPALAEQGDAARGQRDFRACASCHSQARPQYDGAKSRDLWGRKAGSLPSFDRYSDALKASGSSGMTARSTNG